MKDDAKPHPKFKTVLCSLAALSLCVQLASSLRMSCVSEAKPCAICMARLGHVVSAHSRAQQLALDQSCTMCSACLEPTIRSQIFCIWDIQRQHHGAAFWTPQAKVQNICSSEHVLRGVLESCLQRRKSQCRSMGSRVSLDNSCLRVVAHWRLSAFGVTAWCPGSRYNV